MAIPSDPRVSVIIPCFNLGRHLREAVASVRSQTLAAVEIVVVDDGSTDADTADALAAAAGPDLRVIRSENRGLSAARNLGIADARGMYVCCLDADDVIDPAWLELAVARLDADADLAFVSHWVETFGDEQGVWTPGRADLAALLDQNVFNGAALFRRELVGLVGGFDESMRDGCEDWEFWIRVMKAGFRGATIPAVLYRYRRRTGSMSHAMIASGQWFDIFGGMIDRHSDCYRERLLDLMLRREWAIARVCRGIDAVREELSTVLEPAVRERRHELERSQKRLHALEVTEPTRRELDLARQRIEALERSWSWRVTAPLRRVYGWITWGQRSPGQRAS